jgi:6-pyruvoyltetrahydropterin/6-carboxytetrahydropterin synthase
MFTIAKRFSFSASHQLTAAPEGHPCRRLHGHNYEVEVVCAAVDLDDRDMVVDYLELDPVKRFVDETVDHRHLNDVLDGEPTAERLAWWFYESLKASLPGEIAGRLAAVRVQETPRTWAEYRPS